MLTKEENQNIKYELSDEHTKNQKGRVTIPLAQQKIYTIDDIYALPEGQRAELIDGQLYMMAPLTRTHQRILLSLSRIIADYIDKTTGSCEVNVAPFAVFLTKNDKTYVEPDISVTCDSNKLSDKGCFGAPDWIIEIVSPASRLMDYHTKLFTYKMTGVREYWIIDHSKDRITVWDFVNASTEEFSFSDSVSAGLYKDLFIDFSKLVID